MSGQEGTYQGRQFRVPPTAGRKGGMGFPLVTSGTPLGAGDVYRLSRSAQWAFTGPQSSRLFELGRLGSGAWLFPLAWILEASQNEIDSLFNEPQLVFHMGSG